VDIYGIYEGYQGMVQGGDYICKMAWDSVGGILQVGGTVIGTARSNDFRTRAGRLKAAKNLVEHGINALVVIGGDGSLTGADLFRQEWPGLLAELAATSQITAEQAAAYPDLIMAGLVGSIDNDMFGTDMTIGADSALHRIVEAIDALTCTAASHQRTFVVEVMGRHCGYLALMSAIATGANWVLIPEHPPAAGWEDEMCDRLKAGRPVGRRHNIIIVAEGATDRAGKPITSDYVKRVLDERLGTDTRVTILGHVQRGGTPSAFDRWHTTLLGTAAVEQVLSAKPGDAPQLIGLRHQVVIASPLMKNVQMTQQVATEIAQQNYETAMEMRGGNFTDSYRIFNTLVRARSRTAEAGESALRLLVLHGDNPAPGMNTALRTAVRLALDRGHTVLAVRNGFEGLLAGNIQEMRWMDVHGLVALGGAVLGTSRMAPSVAEVRTIADTLEQHQINGILMIGGWDGYMALHELYRHRNSFPAFNIPMVCLPVSIHNNLPGSDLSVGTDTALNNIMGDVDKLKETAVAFRGVFVVEVMGEDCGYLALMAGLTNGAERIYIPEESFSLNDLQADISVMLESFRQGKRLGLIIRNERADPFYTTDFIAAVFGREGRELFEVHKVVLGHVQMGGSPSPFDRIQATRLAARCVSFLDEEAHQSTPRIGAIGLRGGRVTFTDLANLPKLIEPHARRPKDQWWLSLRRVIQMVANPPQ
jgi:6-phosphofructokinase 1